MFSFFKRKRSGGGSGRRRGRESSHLQMGNHQGTDTGGGNTEDNVSQQSVVSASIEESEDTDTGSATHCNHQADTGDNPLINHEMADTVGINHSEQSGYVSSEPTSQVRRNDMLPVDVISKNCEEKISKRDLFFGNLSEGVLKKVKSEGNLSITKNEDFGVKDECVSNGCIESESEKCVNSDDSRAANETGGPKSVTDKVGVGEERAAKIENSAGRDPGTDVRGHERRVDMQRALLYASEGGWSCGEPGIIEEETSSDEDSEDVVKNDSGCWEGPGSVVISGILLRTPGAKKSVKWADIHGQAELTRSQENVPREDGTSEEESSEESEEDVGNKESESSEEESEEEITATTSEPSPVPEHSEKETRAAVSEVKEAITALEESEKSEEEEDEKSEEEESEEEESEEEESEEEEEGKDSVAKEVMCKVKETQQEESDSSDDDSSQEETQQNTEGMRPDVEEMQARIRDLQKEIDTKASNIGRLQVELDSACSESEQVRQRFLRLEEDLETYRKSNRSLAEQLQITEKLEEEKNSGRNRQLKDAERRIREVESDLANVRLEHNQLQTNYKKLQADRDMEVQIIQKALEKALTDQEEMEAKYEKEFEAVRTLSSGREVQMLEDFEWKLREVERNCKKKIQDYEADYQQRNLMLAGQLAAAQVDLEQISHLKLCEIELNQLKQTSSEQRKSLRLVNRKLEELQVSEKILQEEVNSLRSSLDKEKAHIIALQTLHKEELAEKERKTKIKMEIQIKQLTYEWAERLRNDINKLKTDLDKSSREERLAAVELTKKGKEAEICQLRENWERKNKELKDEILKQKNRITEIENHHKNDLNNAQTSSDREAFDLRRKIDKLDMSYQEKIEKLQEKHESELVSLREECDKRVQQSDVALQIQIGNSRTTLELVKQQLRNEAQTKLESIERQYQQRLEQQWAGFQREKEVSLGQQEEKHKAILETIYKEMERTKKQARNELDNLAKRRPQPVANECLRITNPEDKTKVEVSEGESLLSSRKDAGQTPEERRAHGKEELLQRSIQQLTNQLNAGKMEIARLREQLEGRPQQARNQSAQQPVPNPRRHRKGRAGDCYMQ